MDLKRMVSEQKHIPMIGELKQLLGAALSWATILMLAFTGLSAWNTDTMGYVRDHIPWLNLGVFAAILAAGLVFMMWLEHRWIQPSVMAYWNQMNYSQNNHQKSDHERTEAKMDLLLSYLAEKDPELSEKYQKLVEEYNGKHTKK